ncbi:hypothetical protein [Elizabethkingia ursingii]|uniref:hypothetical protein n=1 Tax=Elizabethkingia ursingii TaxID=1756150 RepID=UPI0020121126|nr:hypothetical protein [Elizabethkingia ursingii]MCL1671737.1 hypothetical protein [Elizabethkingia ursingii]
MDKLELKDIAPYLPYKVKVQITEGYYDGKFKNLSGVQYDGLLNLGKGGNFGFIEREYHQVKLLLRPMSDLTKEITHNGETFMPMLYLAGIEDRNNQYLDDDKEGEPIIGIDENDFDMGSMTYAITKRFVYDKDLKCFAIDIYDEGGELEYRESFASESYELLQVLYELHFDVNDLIGRGLAINLNEVDNEE